MIYRLEFFCTGDFFIGEGAYGKVYKFQQKGYKDRACKNMKFKKVEKFK